MRQDVYGEVSALLSTLRTANKLTGFMGVVSPPFVSGQIKFPPHLSATGLTFALTASQQYGAWFFIDKIEAWSGVKCIGNGTADSGKNLKIACWNDSFALEKSFGSQTMGGASAIYTFASSWTPSKIGWFEFRITSDSNPTLWQMVGMRQVTSVGHAPLRPQEYHIPRFNTATNPDFVTQSSNGCSVAGTYANFPESTALTMTTADGTPCMYLYK